MKEKIENQRGIRKTIPLYLRFAESANGTGRDIGFILSIKKRRSAVPNWADVVYKCVGDSKEVGRCTRC